MFTILVKLAFTFVKDVMLTSYSAVSFKFYFQIVPKESTKAAQTSSGVNKLILVEYTCKVG